jgi:hypothetical protein
MQKYENYPWWIVLISNLLSIAIYALGIFVLYKPGILFAILYLIFVLILEFRVIRYHCVNCYYWGKTCGFAKGRISAWLFKQGDSAEFCSKPMTWKEMIPDMLVLLIPLVTGVILLMLKFDWILLIAMLLLIGLSLSGNAFVRGSLTCKYCKQQELGCPANQLFNKEINK